MQLTRFDRWLREKFVYETHIHTLRPPPSMPAGVRAVATPEVSGQRYKHFFIARKSKAADAFIRLLQANSQMYTTRIVDRDVWFRPLLAPKNKSVSWWLVSLVVTAVSSYFFLLYLNSLIQSPEFQQNFRDALKIIKG